MHPLPAAPHLTRARGFVLWVALGLFVVALLNLLPLSWGVAHGQTIPAEPTAVAPLPTSVVAPAFSAFLQSEGVDAVAALGSPLSGPLSGPFTPQYFEKARLEDHSQFESIPLWKIQYGLLSDEMQTLCAGSLQSACAKLSVGGEESSETYANLASQAAPGTRLPAPADFGGGVLVQNAAPALAINPANGLRGLVSVAAVSCTVFIPYDADLRPAPGHDVPCRMWQFMQRTAVFPGGWLHDLGLPITESLEVVVQKGSESSRHIGMQFFQRGYVTDDPLNPPAWQLELGNSGSDRVRLFLAGAPLTGTQ